MMIRTINRLKVHLINTGVPKAFFSSDNTGQNPLNFLKNKADFAIKIMDTICEKPDDLDLMKTSLQEYIVNMIYQDNQLQGRTKNFYESFFKNGIEVDQTIWNQARIQDGKNPQTKNIVFFPTFTVTKQIFNILLNPQNKYNMITGHSGISKTTSACFLYHLVKIIDEYRFSQGAEISEKMKRIPKYIYWSINIYESNVNIIKQNILDQCPEVNDDRYVKVSDYFNNLIKLRKIYRIKYPWLKEIYLIIDQINDYLAIKRTLVNSRSQQKQIIAHIKQMHSSIQNILLHFSKIIYLSSMNPQKKEDKQNQLTSDRNSSLPKRISILYPSVLYQKSTMIELVYFFLFEFQQKVYDPMLSIKLDQEIKKLLIEKCFLHLINKKSKFIVTPLDFRQLMKNLNLDNTWKQALKGLILENKIDQFILKIFQQFTKLIDGTIQDYAKSLANHFFKNDGKDKKRRQLMFDLYRQCNLIKLKKALQDQSKHIPFKKTFSQNNTILIKNLSWKKQEIYQFVDRRLFEMRDINSQYLQILLPVEFLSEFLQPHVGKHIHQYIHSLKSFLKDSHKREDFGNVIENLMILILKIGKTNLTMNLENAKSQNEIYKIHFQIDDSMIFGFKGLPRCQKSNYKLLPLIRNQIDALIKSESKSAVVFPLKKSYKNMTELIQLQKIDGISKMVDLILIQKQIVQSRGLGFINVWIVDVTVSKDQVNKKIFSFMSEFMKFDDKQSNQNVFKNQGKLYEVQVNYVVFGPSDFDFNKEKIIQKINEENRDLIFDQKTPITSKVLKVKSLFGRNCFLNYVGFVNMNQDLIFQKQNNEANIQISRFQTALSVLEQKIAKPVKSHKI